MLIWKIASPAWNFDDVTFNKSEASFHNPDHENIVIHNYRWRLGLADGENNYNDPEKRLAKNPLITVPSITLEEDCNSAPHPSSKIYEKKFTGKYLHRILKGVGHNLPQEALKEFADAIIEADSFLK